MKTGLLILAGGVASYVLSLIWWRLWMYNGFFGPPDFLSTFMKGDGEGIYNRVELEMFIVLFVVVVSAILFFRYKS